QTLELDRYEPPQSTARALDHVLEPRRGPAALGGDDRPARPVERVRERDAAFCVAVHVTVRPALPLEHLRSLEEAPLLDVLVDEVLGGDLIFWHQDVPEGPPRP